MGADAIIALVMSLIQQAVDIGKQIYTSSQADMAALEQRLKDAQAALAGEKTSAHAALDARWAELQALLASKSA